MTKIGYVDPLVSFNRRVGSIKKRFNRECEKLEACRMKVAAAEANGTLFADTTNVVPELKQTIMRAIKALAFIRDTMRQYPQLKLPKEAMSQFTHIILNARFLLARIENVNIVEPPDYNEIPDDPDVIKLSSGIKINYRKPESE